MKQRIAKEIVDALIADLLERIGGLAGDEASQAADEQVKEDLRRDWVTIVEGKL